MWTKKFFFVILWQLTGNFRLSYQNYRKSGLSASRSRLIRDVPHNFARVSWITLVSGNRVYVACASCCFAVVRAFTTAFIFAVTSSIEMGTSLFINEHEINRLASLYGNIYELCGTAFGRTNLWKWPFYIFAVSKFHLSLKILSISR